MIFEKRKTLKEGNSFSEKASSLDKKVKEETIILIGPMGTGKSTIAKLIEKKYSIERLSLDNKGSLEEIYSNRSKYRNLKNFEFMLTGTVLSTLDKPYVIDFGAGHSIYENPDLRKKMQEICKNFQNIILLLPTDDKEKNRNILNERRGFKKGSHKDKDNYHFIVSKDNYELATKIIYEEGKSEDEIADEIISYVRNRGSKSKNEEVFKKNLKSNLQENLYLDVEQDVQKDTYLEKNLTKCKQKKASR
ncbi:MAG: hypothetical protein IJ809_02505 [Clostridia bacterium]|nr:hypothetical protein [Clostridia bacterium]